MKKIVFLFLLIQLQSAYSKSINPVVIDTTNVVIDKNIVYKVTQDINNIFISVETDDRKVSQTILRDGITVYFDSKGKKKKNVFIRYPNKLPKPTKNRQQRPQSNREDEELPDRETLLENLPQEALYNNFDTQREFNTLLNDLDIDVAMDIVKHTKIKYSLRIPKHRINSHPKKGLTKLSIGVLIGRDQSDRPDSSQRPNGQSGGGGNSQGGGPPGGGNGGGGSGGGPPGGGGNQGGGGQGGGPSQENRTQTSAVWFKANSNS